MSLADRLANLYLLLAAPSFNKWPLELRFFAEDVFNAWKKRCLDMGSELDGKMKIFLDKPTSSAVSGGLETVGGFDGIDPSYFPMKDHVEKSAFLLAEGEDAKCDVCQNPVASMQSALVCPMPGCKSTSHMACLGQAFLKTGDQKDVVPRSGSCPSCRSELQWVDLVKELSLRTRGEKEVAKLQKKRRGKGKSKEAAVTLAAEESEASEDDIGSDLEDELDAELSIDVIDEPRRHEAIEDDAASLASGVSSDVEALPPPRRKRRSTKKLENVVEDSEWEGVEVLD